MAVGSEACPGNLPVAGGTQGRGWDSEPAGDCVGPTVGRQVGALNRKGQWLTQIPQFKHVQAVCFEQQLQARSALHLAGRAGFHEAKGCQQSH